MNELICLTVIFSFVQSFNVDVMNSLTYSGNEHSLFGYSAVLLDNWVVVAAPTDNITESPMLKSPGVVYKCPVDFNSQSRLACEPLAIVVSENTTPQHVDSFGGYSQDEQFLGSSMVEIQDNIVICAHRWKLHTSSSPYISLPMGRCHFVSKDLRSIDTNRPFRFQGGIFDTGYSMAGFSATKSKDSPEALLGAPEYFDKGGYLPFRKDQNTYWVYGAVDNSVTKSFLHESYMGYSIAVGRFVKHPSCTADPVLLGMPHYSTGGQGHSGSVVLVCRITDPGTSITLLKQFTGSQIGSGFGYGIVVGDYNADGKDDILISAPFQSSGQDPDVGEVFIFLGTGDNDFLQRTNGSMTGDGFPHGRFGTAMANLGDLSGNGVDVIAISAPYEGTGVVYIFNGKAGTVNTQYSQKIYGESVNTGLRSFGLFISQSRDLDGNLYPDFAVGSALSNRITLLRSRPVVMVTPSIQITPAIIPLNSSGLNCSDDIDTTPCTFIRVCFSFTGPRLEMTYTTYVTYSLHADTERTSNRRPSRVNIIHASSNFGNILLRDNMVLTKDRNTCEVIYLRVNAANRQFFASLDEKLVVTMNYSLSNDISSRQVMPVLNPLSVMQLSDEASFQTGCLGICNPDLQVDIKTDHYLIIFGQTNHLIITVTLTNSGEPAFAPNVLISHTNNTRYLTSRALFQQGSVQVVCTAGEDNVTVDCNCGNVLFQHQVAIFDLVFDVSSLTLQQGDVNDTTIPDVVAMKIVASVPSGVDDNLINNEARFKVPVEFNALLKLNGISSPEQGFISDQTTKLSFTHLYEVYNSGPSPMVASELQVEIPLMNSNLDVILITDTLKVEFDNLTTECLTVIGNSSLSMSIMNKDLVVTTVNPPSAKITSRQNTCNRGTNECAVVKCTLRDLPVNRFSRIQVSFDIDATKFSFKEVNTIAYTTTATVFPVEQNFPFRLLNNATIQVTSFLFPAEVTIEVKPINIWIIIGGVLGGLFFLVILLVVMWKVGFFKRQKKEVVQEYKRKSNYYEKRKTQRLEAVRAKAMSKAMSRSDEVILHRKD